MLEKTDFGTVDLPFTSEEWKITGYAGHVHDLQEVYKKTPIPAQIETKNPQQEDFLYTYRNLWKKYSSARDPCNNPETFQDPQPGNLWPFLQEEAAQKPSSLPLSNIVSGDIRIYPFRSHYDIDYKPPFLKFSKIRSPMRNEDLQHSSNLLQHYTSSYNRVGEKRLHQMLISMAERIAAKLQNCNDNAFKLRRLFKMYDKEQTGMIELEDFRMMVESFGIQLDDDSLLALYYKYDPEGTGKLYYMDLMKILLDKDYYAMYTSDVDNSRQRAEIQENIKIVDIIKERLLKGMQLRGIEKDQRQVIENLFQKVADNQDTINIKDFQASCASIGCILSQREIQAIQVVLKQENEDIINYRRFFQTLNL